jgi:hypothetical protein
MSTSVEMRYGNSFLSLIVGPLVLFALAGHARAGETQLTPEGAPDGAAFGSAVAVQDGLVVVGAPREVDAGGTRQAGAVYVMSTDGALLWRLTPSDAATRYQFGRAVDLDGDVLVVGASYATYVYRFDGLNWVEEAKLEQSCSQGKFGSAVAVSGDRILVGSPHIGCLQVSTKGYVFFYERVNEVWQLDRRFGGDFSSVGSYYGWSVAMEGDLAAVGSPYSARVDVYRHSGTSWGNDSTLRQSGGFGWDVSLRDGRLVVGAPSDNTQQNGAGAAYVYVRSGNAWILEGKLLPPPTSPTQKLIGSYYGTTVGVSGDLLVMGGPQADATQQEDGAVLVFRLQNGSWTYLTTLTAPAAGSYDFLGTALDVRNGAVLAGAPGHDRAGLDVGAAYLFNEIGPADPGPDPAPGNAAPIASFTHSCLFRTCQFDASASTDSDGSIVSYEWYFGDGNSATGVTTSHTYTSDGSYQVRLTVTDNEGAVSRAYLNLYIRGEAVFTLSVTGYLERGRQTALLSWSGANSTHIDVYRGGLKVATTANTGSYTDRMNSMGAGSKTYWVCETGGTACSNTVTVYFGEGS